MKEKCKKANNASKKMSKDLEKVGQVTDKEINVLELVDGSKIGAVPATTWQEYNKQRDEDKNVTERLHESDSFLNSKTKDFA